MVAEPTREVFGPYRLSRLIGRGGMAEVWSATEAGRPLAVKRILPNLCDDLTIVEMFLSEARLAKLLEHPNVVATYEAGLIQGRPFIAMELVEGVDLRKLCFTAGRDEPLPLAFCLDVVRSVCSALEYVHTLRDENGRPLGLIHRDVSHSNVMLTRDGGTVKLLDFGVAKARMATNLSRTRTGEIKGKLGYLAPELLRGEPYDHRADLFSVGVVLHELLTRRRLFLAETDAAVLLKNLHCEVEPPSKLRPEVPRELDRIVLRALEADPKKRYASAGELERDLARLAAGEWTQERSIRLVEHRAPPGAVEGIPPSAPTVVGRRRKRRVGWVIGGVTMLLMAVMAGGALVGRRASAPEGTRRSVGATAPPDRWATPGLERIASEELALPLPGAGAGTAVVTPAAGAEQKQATGDRRRATGNEQSALTTTATPATATPATATPATATPATATPATATPPTATPTPTPTPTTNATAPASTPTTNATAPASTPMTKATAPTTMKATAPATATAAGARGASKRAGESKRAGKHAHKSSGSLLGGDQLLNPLER